MIRPRQEFPTPLFKATLVAAALAVAWVVSLWLR